MLKETLCPGCMEPLDGHSVCPRCGYLPDSGYDADYLRQGTALCDGRYIVGALVRKNGEGGTYAGFDLIKKEACWIREYFPSKLARRRAATGEILPFEGCDAQYKALISDFVDICTEIKRLAVTERVVPIVGEFSDKNTVYAVYKKMDIIPLNSYLTENGGKLPLRRALDIFLPFCNMVANIHDHGYIHRGIWPYSVYADKDGSLYLWDFSIGAARTANSELDCELFNGYSAPEQYASNGWQGTWTDIYALAALFYRMISGFVPPKSTLVGGERPLASLDDLVMDIPKNISDTVWEAMISSAENRTKSVYAFTSGLIDAEISNTSVYDTHRTRQGQREGVEKDGGFKYAIAALILTVVVLIGGVWFVMTSFFPQMINQPSSSEDMPPEPDISVEDDGESEASAVSDPNVPDFIGQTAVTVEAIGDYKGRFDFIIKEEYNDDFPAGMIFDQSPEAGTPMPGPGAVVLYVSRGPELIKMPDLVGKSFDEALEILGENNLSCERIDRHVAGAAPDAVVGTIPSSGEEFNPKKQEISIFVMPDPNQSSQQSESESDSKSSSSSKKSSGSSPSSSKSSSGSKKSSSSSKKNSASS